MYAATMTTSLAEKPAELTAARRLTDPREKLRRVAETIELADRQMEPRRLRRNAAAIILFRDGQAQKPPMQPAAMWRDTLMVSRSLWHKIMDEANEDRLAGLRTELDEKITEIAELPTERASELIVLGRERDRLANLVARSAAQIAAVRELTEEIADDPEVGHRLLAIAREEAAEVRRLEMLIPEAKQMRDALVVPLLNGTHGKPEANADVARMAKLSTARVAQLRGTRLLG